MRSQRQSPRKQEKGRSREQAVKNVLSNGCAESVGYLFPGNHGQKRDEKWLDERTGGCVLQAR
jgi:hypothetical protein